MPRFHIRTRKSTRIVWEVTQSCTTWHHGESEGRVARPSSGRGAIGPRVTALRTFPNVPPDGPARAPHQSAHTSACAIGLHGHVAGLWPFLPFSGGSRVRGTRDLFVHALFHIYRLVLGQHSVIVPRVWLPSSYFVSCSLFNCMPHPSNRSVFFLVFLDRWTSSTAVFPVSIVLPFLASLPLSYLFGTRLGMCHNVWYREQRCSLP